ASVIHFSCPSCGMALSAPEAGAGRHTNCRQCDNPVTVPQPSLPQALRDKPDSVSSAPGMGKPGPRPPGKVPNRPTAKSQLKTAKVLGPARPVPSRGPSPSGGSRVFKLGAIILLVVAGGGLFGFGVFRYLGATKEEEKGTVSSNSGEQEKRDAGRPTQEDSRR